MSYLSEIRQFLIDTALFNDYTIQYNRLAEDEQSINLFATTGTELGKVKGDICYSIAGLQIIILDKSFDNAEDNAKLLTQQLLKVLENYNGVTRIEKATGGFFSLGQDDRGFNRISMNFLVILDKNLTPKRIIEDI